MFFFSTALLFLKTYFNIRWFENKLLAKIETSEDPYDKAINCILFIFIFIHFLEIEIQKL